MGMRELRLPDSRTALTAAPESRAGEVFGIITIPVMTHAVKLDMPRANNAPSTATPVVIQLEIDFDGTVLWNGTPVPDLDTLESYFRTEAAKEPQPELHIRPSKRVEYDVVARVLAAAQRSQMRKIGFVGNEQFM